MLLLHVALGPGVRPLMTTDLGLFTVGLLAFLSVSVIMRCLRPATSLFRRTRLLAELLATVSVIAGMVLHQSVPGLSLPWLIGVAAIFPLAFEGALALLSVMAIAGVGLALNIHFGMQLNDWLPHMIAILFVGLSATFLSKALASNLEAMHQANLNARRFDAIARATRHVFMITDAQYKIKFANPALQEIIGYTQDEIEQKDIQPVLHPDDMEEHQRKLIYLRRTPNSAIFSRHRTLHKNGHWVWLDTRGYNLLHDDAIKGLVFSIEDISARKDAELKLDEEHSLLRTVLDLHPSMIYAKDTQGRFTMSNLAFQRRFGYSSEEELRGKTVYEAFLAHPEDGRELDAYELADQFHLQDLQVIESGKPLEDLEIKGLGEKDVRRWYRTNKYPLRDGKGNITGVLGITRDITERKKYEMLLEHQALHDPLTGLPNRRYLIQTIAEVMAQLQAQSRTTSRRLAMLFCDLDFFKSVNDTHGHEFGDRCLMELTRRILAELPDGDFVARFGGNEFVILANVTLAEAKAKADALLQAVSQRLVLDDAAVKIQASIGIAQLDPEHKNPSELIRDADAAMYQAKERGRNRAEIFDASLRNMATKRAQMDVALRFALERDELTLVYQPKVSVVDGSVKGFEMLLRWNHPQYGEVPPTEFIPVAESSGLVVPIGLWALEEACKQVSIWQARYPEIDKLTVAVNVSMRQILHSSFLHAVTSIFERTGVAPQSIELELTETSAMANPVQTIENLSLLKQLGLRLALDDFGTGYSSLAYLQKLPIDVLKIDKAFVQGLVHSPNDAEIVRLILALAKALNIDTIAEGVETREDMIELKKMGCHLAQGFVFSPPVSAEAAEEFLLSSRQFSVA
jgi:diguanylate cyclase (GGDEF)-like protein/PAS domain S-box-containing protein